MKRVERAIDRDTIIRNYCGPDTFMESWLTDRHVEGLTWEELAIKYATPLRTLKRWNAHFLIHAEKVHRIRFSIDDDVEDIVYEKPDTLTGFTTFDLSRTRLAKEQLRPLFRGRSTDRATVIAKDEVARLFQSTARILDGSGISNPR